MISLALSLLLAQTAPTQAELIGALNAISSAWDDRANRTINRVPVDAPTRVCVRFAGGVRPPGTVTVRAGAAMISKGAANALWPTLNATHDIPVMIEVQAVPTSVRTFDPRIRNHIEVLEHELEIRATPVNALCEVGIVRIDDASLTGLFRCACSTGSACKAADGTTAAPTGITLQPEQFTPSAACRPKPCVVRGDLDEAGKWVDRSWPTACPR